MAGVERNALAGALCLCLLQHPKAQKCQPGIVRSGKLGKFSRGENFFGDIQLYLAVGFFRINAHRSICQHAKGVTSGVGDGKMPGGMGEIGLSAGFPELGKAGAAEVIKLAGFDENVRGETLGIPEFARIANEIAKKKGLI